MKRSFVFVCLLTATSAQAATLSVAPGQSIQNAINQARPGDEIVLQAGGTYTGELLFPEKGGTQPIVVRSSLALPLRRITPADRTLLPSLGSGSVAPAATVTGSHWHFVGLAFRANTNGQANLIHVRGDASDVLFDRLLMEGGPVGQRRGIALNGRSTTITRCHIANMWQEGNDSQAVAGWDGPGPFVITDNYLEGASENIIFGGADPSSIDRIPSDIRIEGNLITKNLAWKAVKNKYAVKNLLELKNARRVVIRGNVLEHNWVDGQAGAAIVFTPRNADGTAPYSTVEDVLFENNVVNDTVSGFNILGRSDANIVTGQATRITIRNNLLTNVSDYMMQVGGEVGTLTFDHNTTMNSGSLLLLYYGDLMTPTGTMRTGQYAVASLTFTNNLGRYGTYGIVGQRAAIGLDSLEQLTLAYDWRRNVVAGGNAAVPFPPDTQRPTLSYFLAQFNPDYTLVGGSPYKGAALDGTDLGKVGGGFTAPGTPAVPQGMRIVR